jgi:hypothetical protein
VLAFRAMLRTCVATEPIATAAAIGSAQSFPESFRLLARSFDAAVFVILFRWNIDQGEARCVGSQVSGARGVSLAKDRAVACVDAPSRVIGRLRTSADGAALPSSTRCFIQYHTIIDSSYAV